MKKIGNTEYTTFDDVWNEPGLLDDDEKASIDFEVALIGRLVEAREAKGLTQKELAERAGLKQSAVARLENMKATPQINTLFKLLRPLGYTLAIVPAQESHNDRPSV